MTMTYSYEKAKKSFDLVFNRASSDGKVVIKKGDQMFVITIASKTKSALDVPGVDFGITVEDIVKSIHEGRNIRSG